MAAEEALKGTPLAKAKIYIAGAASTYKDWRDGSKYDLLIAGVGALCLIFIIMLIITRSFVAALVIVGTVALSIGRIVWRVGVDLAVSSGHGIVLDGTSDVCDHPFGGGV